MKREMLVKYLKPQWPKVLFLAVLLLGGIALQLINPQIIRFFLDTAQAGNGPQQLLLATGAFITFALAQQVFLIFTRYLGENVSWTATNQLRADLALHCLRLDMSFHKRHTPGELIQRIDGDITALANFFSQFIIRVVGYALLVAGILVLLFREDPRIGLGMTFYTAVMLVIPAILQRAVISRWTADRQAAAEQYGFLEERISGAEEIRAMGAEVYTLNRLYVYLRNWLEKRRSAFLLQSLIYNLTDLLVAVGYAFGLAVGVLLYIRGQASIGTAYLIVAYIGMLSAPVQSIREQVQDLQQAAASINRIQDLFQNQPLVTIPGSTSRQPAQLRPAAAISVEFRDVSFSYDDNANVIKNITFNLPAGKVLGVLGRTGSGKTTLTRLLFRLYDPSSGTVFLDGMDIRNLPLPELRQTIGLVTQDVQLFQASIRDNLTFFDEQISDERIIHALQELMLLDWLHSLPEGLDTRIAAGGQGLSAGEAQLFAFTRVFLKDPRLIVLDEASSRLDPATENLLERAIDRLFRGRTGILIAHRLQTVQRADEILILEDGRIAEFGPRLLLAKDPASRFYELLQTGLEEALV